MYQVIKERIAQGFANLHLTLPKQLLWPQAAPCCSAIRLYSFGCWMLSEDLDMWLTNSCSEVSCCWRLGFFHLKA